VAQTAGTESPDMMRICIIGSGNVGTRLALALSQAGHQITGVYSRQISRASTLGEMVSAPGTNQFSELNTGCDIVILAVYDDAIEHVYQTCKIFFPEQLFLHTAGSVPITVFGSHPKSGALWPVQTLSASDHTSMRQVPIAITGNTDQAIATIESLAMDISDSVYQMRDSERLSLHLCATFANNFSNHMYAIAEQILQRDGLPFGILHPIIEETAQKIRRMSPIEAQTGAAIRGDITTMQKHLELLKIDPELVALYERISESIRRMGK
jgi:predicted short-subunit dehydrogenase-like oxidoreductase (DUF2520 family)